MASRYHLSPTGADLDCTHCNCDGPCLIGSDAFTRGDSDSLGGDWSERSGDADIVSNQLKFITTGVVRYETAHPDGTSGNQHVDVDFILASTADYARVIVNYTDDSNYLYASIEQVSSCWVLRLRQVNGGSDTSLQDDDVPFPSISTGIAHNFKVCWNPTTSTLQAIVEAGDTYASQNGNAVTISDGSKVGLAGTDDVIFDNFEFWILKDATHTNCPDCQSECFIGSDDFDRSDSTDLGCQWEEVTGTWEIVSNKLSQTTTHSGTSSIVRYKVFHPTLDFNHYVEVDITLPDQLGMTVQNGARVLVNYFNSSNYHWAQLKINEAGDEVQMAIGKNSTTLASAVQSISATLPVTYRMTVCWDDDNLTLTASVQEPDWTLGVSATSTSTSGKFVGLYGDGDASELFDNFEFWKHLSEEEPDCPDCAEFTTTACETSCCATTPAAAYTVDLGTGWDGAECTCGDIVGEFLLQATEDCLWSYADRVACTEAPLFRGFAITLSIVHDVANDECYWQVLLIVHDVDSTPDRTDDTIAVYESDPFELGSDCTAVPVTLTKVSAAALDPCDGGLPATITLDLP